MQDRAYWLHSVFVKLPTAALLLVSSMAAANAFELDFRTTGLPEEDSESLAERLRGASLLTVAKEDGTSGGQDIIAAARSDYKRLISVLYAQSYFSPYISIKVNGQEASDISPFADISSVSNVVVTVAPGPTFVFGQTRIAPLTPDTELPEEFAPQQPAILDNASTAGRTAIDGWRADGHAKAQVIDQSITANHSANTLNVDVTLDPGPKLTFGDLRYQGQSDVRPERVVEIADLPTGEVFSPDTVRQVSARLRRTETFRTIDLREAEEPNPDGSLDMNLTLVDNKPRRFGFGAELESRDGVSVSTFWMHRNLRGGAENLRFDASIENLGAQNSGVNYRFGALYTRPATFRSDTALVIGGEIKREDEDLYLLHQIGGAVGIRRIYSDRFEFSLNAVGFVSDVEDNFGDRHFKGFGVSGTLKFDDRDNISNPTRGYYFEARAFPYLGGGDAQSTVYIESDLRGYRGFGADNGVIAAGRLQIGSVLGSTLRSTPPDLLFYSGGGGTVRGQPYQSNFVTVNGVESGGLSFLGLSGELRIKINDLFSAVTFYDAGFIGETPNIWGEGNWHAGAGIGARYNTGFGPLRFDLALPVSGGTGDGLQLYIGIGHAY